MKKQTNKLFWPFNILLELFTLTVVLLLIYFMLTSLISLGIHLSNLSTIPQPQLPTAGYASHLLNATCRYVSYNRYCCNFGQGEIQELYNPETDTFIKKDYNGGFAQFNFCEGN
jgi:hypothetical protein